MHDFMQKTKNTKKIFNKLLLENTKVQIIEMINTQRKLFVYETKHFDCASINKFLL